MKRTVQSFTKSFLIIFSILFLSTGFNQAQTPKAFKYQAVARDASGEIIANTDIDVRIRILKGISSGNFIYSEIHEVRTNQFGLINIEVGNGKEKFGIIDTINWSVDDYYLQVEIGNQSSGLFQILGKSKLLSVPYALYAETAANVEDADADSTNELQILSYSNDTLYLSKGNWVHIPEIHDNDTTNELQLLSINEDTLFLSKGNYVVLPPAITGSPWNTNGYDINYSDGNVGILIANPQRSLHVNGTIRLNPRDTAPSLPSEGDIYMDSLNHNLMVFNGTQWRPALSDHFDSTYVEFSDKTIIASQITTPGNLVNLDSGLVAYFPFNGSANDVSGNSNHGTVNGATLTQDRFSNATSAYYFDGYNDYIQGVDNNLPLGSSPRSITVWVKPTEINSDYDIFGWGTASKNKANGVSIHYRNYNYSFLSYYGWNNDLHLKYEYNPDEWMFLTATYDGNIAKLYVNAILIGQEEKQWNTTSTGHYYIGVLIGIMMDFFEGTIDDLRVYNRVLNNYEINSLYNEPDEIYSNSVTLDSSNLYLNSSDAGVVLKSTDGTCWKLSVENNGSLTTTQIDCPEVE